MHSKDKIENLRTNIDTKTEKKLTKGHIRCAHFVILPVICLMFCSYGSDFYMVQQWIQHYVKQELGIVSDSNSTNGCRSKNHSSAFKTVEQRTADWVMYNSLATSLPGFFGALLVPSYSDSCGRKLFFLLSCSSSVIRTIIHGLCVYYSWNLIWVVFATGLDSITGGVYTFLSASMSYTADITASGRGRTFGLTLLDGCLLLCITSAGLLSGLVIQYKGFVFLSVMNVALTFLSWLITLTALPETHAPANRTKVQPIWKTLYRIIDIYASKAIAKRRWAYLLLIAAYFFEELTSSHRSSMEILYQLGQPLCWSADQVGIFSAARHFTQGLAGILMIAPLKRCMSETYIALWSTVTNGGSFILEALAQTDLAMFLVPLLSTFAFLTVPMLKSILSTMTPADKQGSIFASIVAINCLCGVVASVVLNQIYASTVSFFNGFVFLVLAVVCLLVFILILIFAKTQKVVPADSPEYVVNSPGQSEQNEKS